MLAYGPGFSINYDLNITALSLFVAIVLITAGFATASFGSARWGGIAGGALAGIGIACMHYMGMASLLIPAEIVWMPGCNEVQGYLIGPPQPIAHYHGFVASCRYRREAYGDRKLAVRFRMSCLNRQRDRIFDLAQCKAGFDRGDAIEPRQLVLQERFVR